MIIAIDGPAGSGKSTTAKAVAQRLGFQHLDSGAFYRAITYAALANGIPASEWSAFDEAKLERLHVRAELAPHGFEFFAHGRNISAEIRSAEVNAHVSQMAAIPAVRGWLLDQLRAAGREGNLVADGRDIGTVVFPDADVKVFLVAQSEARAKRRLAEMGNVAPSAADLRSEVERLGARDHFDTARAAAPLRQAADAVVIDTTDMSFEEQVQAIVDLATERMGKTNDM